MPDGQKTILIVDDEPELQNDLDRHFRLHGYKTLLAEDGAKALRELKRHSVDLVILDLLMPNKDGFETVIELKRRDARLPVFMMGAHSVHGFDFLAAAKKFGADAVFRKPIRGPELLAAVDAHFAPSRWRGAECGLSRASSALPRLCLLAEPIRLISAASKILSPIR
jgi:DNA-binding response OmpR family regulator